MAKSQLFSNPLFRYVFKHGGVFPVRRGYDDEEAFMTAHTVLDRGGCVLMYAEGGRSRSGDLGEPKRGVGKLALESGVPVVPVAIHGSAGVRGWKRLRFPKVTVQFGEPLTFPVVDGRPASSSRRSRTRSSTRCASSTSRSRRRAAAACSSRSASASRTPQRPPRPSLTPRSGPRASRRSRRRGPA